MIAVCSCTSNNSLMSLRVSASAWLFSNFIKHLASRAAEAVPGQPLPQWLPWQPTHANDKYETLLAAREFWKRPNEGGRYV